jgi:endonuclease YncB( thermonuclease family)
MSIKAKPILFSGPMVIALIEGRKTQTRRAVKPQPVDGDRIIYDNPGFAVGRMRASENAWTKVFPKFEPGDEMWVRETWAPTLRGVAPDGWQDLVRFAADGTEIEVPKEHTRWFDALSERGYHNRPSIHMPRWASRLTLTVTDVRVERLQDISEEDAYAEGVEIDVWDQAIVSRNYSVADPKASGSWFQSWRPDCGAVYVDEEEVARASYRTLWESINGPGSWAANPWVWAVSFGREVTHA